MEWLDGRVAVITGAGRGLGREHALLFAQAGAKVVVNDLGAATDGAGKDAGAAQSVVDEITAAGGEAVASTHSVSDWEGARRIVNTAVEAFGDLHVVVNNAGFLRDKMLVNMEEDDWDAIMSVHVKGTFAVTRWAAQYWREQSKAGSPKKAAVVNTSSASGLKGIVGQTNYAAAKAGILTFSLVANRELSRYGVRVNAICPEARTRLTLASPGTSASLKAGPTEGWDRWDPANVSPMVAYLATEECTLNGQVFVVGGSRVSTYRGWTKVDHIETTEKWDLAELSEAVNKLPTDLNPLYGE